MIFHFLDHLTSFHFFFFFQINRNTLYGTPEKLDPEVIDFPYVPEGHNPYAQRTSHVSGSAPFQNASAPIQSVSAPTSSPSHSSNEPNDDIM